MKPKLWQVHLKRYNKDMIKNYCKTVREAKVEEDRVQANEAEPEAEEDEAAKEDLRRPYLQESEELLTSQNGDLHLNPVKFTSSSDQQKSEKVIDLEKQITVENIDDTKMKNNNIKRKNKKDSEPLKINKKLKHKRVGEATLETTNSRKEDDFLHESSTE